MRPSLITTALVGLVAVGLTGCAGGPDGGTVADGCTPSGPVSDSIDVQGEFGAKPEVSFETPLEVSATQRTVVIEGDGEVAEAGDSVQAELSMYDAATGEEIVSTGHDGSQRLPLVLDETFVPAFVKSLMCSAVGTRAVTVVMPEDAYGETGNPQLGIDPEASLVFVTDLVAISDPPLPRADGEPRELPADFPAVEVELDDDGRPTVTIPDGEPPAELHVGLLKEGSGDTVEAGDNVTVHYMGVSWDTGEVFDESWSRGEPIPFNTNQVVEGFASALIGQQVGSQVVAVIPPELAYGGAESGHALGGQTLVFVVDILATG